MQHLGLGETFVLPTIKNSPVRLSPFKLKQSIFFLLFLSPIPPAIDALAPDPSLDGAENAQNGNDEDLHIPAHTQPLEAKRGEFIIVERLAAKRGIICKVPNRVAMAGDGLIALRLSLRVVGNGSRDIAHHD